MSKQELWFNRIASIVIISLLFSAFTYHSSKSSAINKSRELSRLKEDGRYYYVIREIEDKHLDVFKIYRALSPDININFLSQTVGCILLLSITIGLYSLILIFLQPLSEKLFRKKINLNTPSL